MDIRISAIANEKLREAIQNSGLIDPAVNIYFAGYG